MTRDKLIRKISFNVTAISGTLLGGVVLSNHPVTVDTIGLAAVFTASSIVYIKSSRKK